MAEDQYDDINRPRHYAFGTIEPIAVIEDWGLGFNLGNVIKYIARAQRKGAAIKDLKKAEFYLRREQAATPSGTEESRILGQAIISLRAQIQFLEEGAATDGQIPDPGTV